jgi:hypothetical protein
MQLVIYYKQDVYRGYIEKARGSNFRISNRELYPNMNLNVFQHFFLYISSKYTRHYYVTAATLHVRSAV